MNQDGSIGLGVRLTTRLADERTRHHEPRFKTGSRCKTGQLGKFGAKLATNSLRPPLQISAIEAEENQSNQGNLRRNRRSDKSQPEEPSSPFALAEYGDAPAVGVNAIDVDFIRADHPVDVNKTLVAAPRGNLL